MGKVVLDGSGVVVFTAMTPEYLADIQAWNAARCSDHPNAEWRRRPTASGGVQIRRQCLDCGHVIGNARKQTPEDRYLPEVDPLLAERYENQRQVAWRAIEQKHARLQHERDNSFFKEYDAYLNSEQWKAKRKLVFKRAGGTCEGCGLKPATEVHHLTYKHHMNEFLFELVAVCTECHERLHEDELEGEGTEAGAVATDSSDDDA